MSGALVLLLPLVAIFALLGAVLVAVPRRRKLVAINERDFPKLARLRATTAVARALGFVAGLLIAVPLMASLRFGLGVFLAPAVFAGTQILATLVAEMLTRNAARTPGTSGLEVRRIRPYLPRPLTALTASITPILALVLGWTTAVAVADDMGNKGRAFSYSYPCEGECSRGFSPWPGSFYSIPAGLLLAAVLALAVIAVIVTVRRPRDASDPEIVRVDDLVRARTVETIVAAVGVGSATTLLGVSFLASNLLGNPVHETPLVLLISGWGAVVLAAATLAMTVWCVVVLLLPGATAPLRRDSATAPNTARVEA